MPSAPPYSVRPHALTQIGIALALIAVGLAFLRTAAVTEDAFITFRVIDNALNGHGLVWNTGERVQPYTHPLWMLLLLGASASNGDIYTTSLVLSMALTLLTCFAITAQAQTLRAVLWAALALLVSEAFLEYASAGLENALAHALLAMFALGWWRWPSGDPRSWRTALCAGLLVVTRHDFALLVAPALVVLAWNARGLDRVRVVCAAIVPLAAWTIFAVIYYGSPWPNSAYAKLNAGLTLIESLRASTSYFRDFVRYDPVSAATISIATIAALLAPRWRSRSVGVGLLLYLGYIASIGGDYMGGRLFSPPFVLSVALITRSAVWQKGTRAMLFCVLTVLLGVHHGWLVWDVHPHARERKLSQHAWIYPFTGWLSPQREPDFRNMPWANQGLRAKADGTAIVAKCAVGLFGFEAGPRVHIVDPLAITDAFLARLPAKSNAYPGHFERAFPDGYLESVRDDENKLNDPALATLFRLTRRLARGPLFTRERWEAIWVMNTGGDRELVTEARYDPNATWAPGLTKTSDLPLACMGQLDPLLTVRIK